jgi:hypothetical protein
MPRGGLRPNAGRKKGSLNAKTQKVAERCFEEGITPLEYMLNVMRDPTQEFDTRMDAAKSCAPYMHPKLASVEQKVEAEVNGTIYEWLTGTVADIGQSVADESSDVCPTGVRGNARDMATGSTAKSMH